MPSLKKSFSVLSPTPFNVRKLSPIGLFYRYNIVVNRLTTVIYFYFTVWIFFFQYCSKSFCFFFRSITTIINTDYFCIISHHGIYGCNSNIFFAAAYCKNTLVTNTHNVTFVYFLIFYAGITHCIGNLTSVYAGNGIHHFSCVFFSCFFWDKADQRGHTLWNCLGRDDDDLFIFGKIASLISCENDIFIIRKNIDRFCIDFVNCI